MTTIRNDCHINQNKKQQKYSLHRSSSSALTHRGHKQNEELGIKRKYSHSCAINNISYYIIETIHFIVTANLPLILNLLSQISWSYNKRVIV